jgi:hypothetical protein
MFLFTRTLRLRRLLLSGLFVMLPLVSSAAGLELLWTYDSGSIGAGRKISSVSTLTVGTDGSVGFVVQAHDGSFGNQEYRMYWLDSAMNDLADDGALDNEWVNEALQPLAIRKDHLIYLSNQQLRSMTRDDVGDVADVSVGSAFGAASATTWMVEQSRNPGVFYFVETAGDALTFKLHAYALTPVNNEELLVPTEVGIDTGDLQMRFPTKTDAAYQVQSSEDLVTWVDEGAQIIGNGNARTFSYTVSSETKKFFRVRKL